VDPALAAAGGDGVLRRLSRVNARAGLVDMVVPPLALTEPVLLGVAAVAAIGLSAVELGGPKDASGLGAASDSARSVAAQLDRGEGPSHATGQPVTSGEASVPVMDPWSDLPPVSIADQVAGTEFDPWATTGEQRAEPEEGSKD
jgi:hypothetical protein